MKRIEEIKFGGLVVWVDTAKLKSLLPATRNDVMHAVVLLDPPGTSLCELQI